MEIRYYVVYWEDNIRQESGRFNSFDAALHWMNNNLESHIKDAFIKWEENEMTDFIEVKSNLSIVSSPATMYFVLDGDKHSKIVYKGTYTQCLVYSGGIALGESHEEAEKTANEVNDLETTK